MKTFNAQQTISGKHGELWINSIYMAEVFSVEAKITLKKEEIKQVKQKGTGYKIVGWEGKGTIKLHKVSSFFINFMMESIKNGKQPVCTITSKLSDPDSGGTERIVLKGCTFDELTIVDWEAEKVLQESLSFTFNDCNLAEKIIKD